MKEILNKVMNSLVSDNNSYCRVRHKRGWLEYLASGDLGFNEEELHCVFRQVIDSDRPGGEKLFHLRKSLNFTIMPDKRPYRTEEALERFIVVSNTGDFYNQIPIGGGKESIDIGIVDSDSKFTFVELKPWESQNSPMYALVESLKNLIEYRTILEKRLADIPYFREIDLIVLAPPRLLPALYPP
jgi:hypothetical protein